MLGRSVFTDGVCVSVSVCALLSSLTLTADLINTDPTLPWHLVHLLSLCSTGKLLYCFILWVVERGKSESSKTGFINSITGNYQDLYGSCLDRTTMEYRKTSGETPAPVADMYKEGSNPSNTSTSNTQDKGLMKILRTLNVSLQIYLRINLIKNEMLSNLIKKHWVFCFFFLILTSVISAPQLVFFLHLPLLLC